MVTIRKQLDGVAIGSPLGPALTNVFLCHHERKWLRECKVPYALICYKHYIDNLFVLLMSENHVNDLLFYLNWKHPNVRFTREIEKDRSKLHKEIVKLKSVLRQKGYPTQFQDKIIS